MNEPVNIYDKMEQLIENTPVSKLSKSDDSAIYLFDGQEWYAIELERCDTHTKMVAWLDHLSRKSWVTKAHMKEFMTLCFCAKDELAANLPA